MSTTATPPRRAALCAVATATALLSLPTTAEAQWAAEAFGGVTWPGEVRYDARDIDMLTGLALGGRVMYVPPARRLSYGLEISYTDSEYVGWGTNLRSLGAFGLARYTVPTKGRFSGYATAGLGYMQIEYDGQTNSPTLSGTDTQLGGQIALGLAYDWSEKVTVFSEWAYRETFEDSEIQGITDVEFNSTTVVFGARMNF